MTTEFLFKIRDRNTGLYSTGGQLPKFTQKGKVWRSLAHLKLHIRMLASWREIPESWEIVEFHISERTSLAASELLRTE